MLLLSRQNIETAAPDYEYLKTVVAVAGHEARHYCQFKQERIGLTENVENSYLRVHKAYKRIVGHSLVLGLDDHLYKELYTKKGLAHPLEFEAGESEDFVVEQMQPMLNALTS